MGTEPSPHKQLAILSIALGGVLALGAWVGLVVFFPRLGSRYDEQIPGRRDDHLVIEEIRGVFGSRLELQLQHEYEQPPVVRWRAPLSRAALEVVLAPSIAILRMPSDPDDPSPRLEAYDYDTGVRRWQVADDGGTRSWLAEEAGLLVEAWSAPTRVRALELATGRVRWDVHDEAFVRASASAWTVRRTPHELQVITADAFLAIALEDGTIRHATPTQARSVAACGSLVASLSLDGSLRIDSIAGGASVEVGRAPSGRVSCAVGTAGRALIGWTRGDDGRPQRPGRGVPLDDGVVPAIAPGAVFGVRGAGSVEAQRSFAFTTTEEGPLDVSFERVCIATFDGHDPPLPDGVMGEPPEPPPEIAFDCETGAVAEAPSRW